MRALGRVLALLLLLLVGWPLYQEHLAASIGRLTQNGNANALLPHEAERSTVFWLDSERWLRFSLTENTPTLRILSHLQMRPEQTGEGALNRFALAYRLVDADGSTLKDGSYHYKAVVLPHRELPDGGEFPPRFYDQTGLIASAAENLFLDLTQTPAAATLELRAEYLPDSDNRIGVQVSAREIRPREAASRHWQRLSKPTKERMLRGHIYPTHLISPYEIENALMARWLPLGPDGISGDDFTSDTLYTLSVPPAPPRDASLALPPGLYADPHNWVTLAIPDENPGRYRLEVEPVDHAASRITVNFSHQRNSDLQIEQRLLSAETSTLTWSGTLDPGLVQIVPSAPVSVRLLDDETGAELTPPQNYLRADIAAPQQPLHFQLNADSAEVQPVRFDFRTHLHPELGDSAPAAEIQITVENRQGEVLAHYRQPIDAPPSHYVRFSDLPSQSRVSDRQSVYLDAPAQAHRLRISSNTSVLVTAYSRLDQLALERRLPDERRPWQDYEARLPSWFLMQSLRQPQDRQRQASLQWFFRPIERNPALLSGDYEWQALATAEPALQREVLFPHQVRGPLRQTAVGTVFRALPSGPTTLTLQAPEPGIGFTPELIYRRASAEPETVTVFRDGQIWLRRGIAGRSGRFSLPMTSAGRHTLTIQASGQWYINHNRPDQGSGYLQRTSYRLPPSGLSFVIDKTDEREVVNLDLIAPPGAARYPVQVRLDRVRRSNAVLSDYTILNRRFELAIAQQETLLLGTRSALWGTPVTVAVPLGEDLPAGRYQITVRPETEQPGLVAAYTIREGQRQSYRFFRRSLDGY
ncbi:hypothetical protein [Marinobacter sp. SS21]|uniref:hypothetical protein n=1 Tax=Marinobacter sp. SS21 TaxID=2979460 RepID=UPI00232D19BC|nr:hypothetical protein [Marinobacter sp. SS21]MDC0662937.1 hypothetical protein [Marinobacter sp. SS21]